MYYIVEKTAYEDSYSKANLWVRALGHMFILSICFIMIPMILLSISINLIDKFNPSLASIINVIETGILYLLGVYITYKHVIWRKTNLSQLQNLK